MNVKFHKMTSFTWIFQNILCIQWIHNRYIHNSREIWYSFSRTPLRNFLWCYYRWLITSLALQKCETENAIFFKLFWYKVFVHWELKLLNFLVDSVLNVLWSDFKLNCSLKKKTTSYVYLLRIPTFEIWTDILLSVVCLLVCFFFVHIQENTGKQMAAFGVS